MIPESFIQELINRIDIVDVIDKRVPLKKAGANYSACCPFHNEKSPSFTVSPVKQFYHCFGCGAHGTAIGFIMEYQGISFVEAVQELAKMAGMIVPQEERPAAEQAIVQQQKQAMLGMQESLQLALNYYRAQLKQSAKAIDYLKGRGLSGQVAARFQMGYAPAAWQNLAEVFSDYQAESLRSAGLVVENEQGKQYDRFRDRIMFPIHDQKGQVIGFGGRVLTSGKNDDGPKYLNSPETPLFQKGHELYGLFLARRAIREANKVLVVEGYMDVVALAQYGIEYAVAALGTATTPAHISKLMRQTDNIVFCFDGDEAGKKAAWRAAMNALPALNDGLVLRFLFLPAQHDPDSYVREFGKQAFEAAMDSALHLSQYLVQQLSMHNALQAQEDKVRFLNEAEPILQAINAPRLSLLLQKEIAEKAGVTLQELQATLKLKSPMDMARQQQKGMQRARPVTPALTKKLMLLLLHSPQLAHQIRPQLLQGGKANEEVLRQIYQVAVSIPDMNSAMLLQSLQGVLPADIYRELSGKLVESMHEEDIGMEFAGALKQLISTWEKTASSAAEILEIAQQRGLNALTEEQKSILQKSRWGHSDKNS